MQVPAFLLRRLYVKGSLRNEGSGIAFELENQLGSGYAEQVLPLLIDDEPRSLESTWFVVDGEALRFADVSPERPMTLGMNKAVTVRADGLTLAPGKHTIALGFIVTGMGEMRFDVTDAIDG